MKFPGSKRGLKWKDKKKIGKATFLPSKEYIKEPDDEFIEHVWI